MQIKSELKNNNNKQTLLNFVRKNIKIIRNSFFKITFKLLKSRERQLVHFVSIR